MDLFIYTDGSCWKGDGSWAFVAVAKSGNEEHVINRSGFVSPTTSNRMEMTAVIRAAEWVLANKFKISCLVFSSDSQYTVNMFNGEWKIKEVTKNKDLIEHWNSLKPMLGKAAVGWGIDWIRGHDGNKWNEMADELCTVERERNVKANKSSEG